jgi:hypothetical protein
MNSIATDRVAPDKAGYPHWLSAATTIAEHERKCAMTIDGEYWDFWQAEYYLTENLPSPTIADNVAGTRLQEMIGVRDSLASAALNADIHPTGKLGRSSHRSEIPAAFWIDGRIIFGEPDASPIAVPTLDGHPDNQADDFPAQCWRDLRWSAAEIRALAGGLLAAASPPPVAILEPVAQPEIPAQPEAAPEIPTTPADIAAAPPIEPAAAEQDTNSRRGIGGPRRGPWFTHAVRAIERRARNDEGRVVADWSDDALTKFIEAEAEKWPDGIGPPIDRRTRIKGCKEAREKVLADIAAGSMRVR